jgi:hypothetical protein
MIADYDEDELQQMMDDLLRDSLGFQKEPLLQGYITYLGQLLHGDFGISTSNFPSPVSEVIGRTLPYSIFLVGVAFLFAFVIGTFLGLSLTGYLLPWDQKGYWATKVATEIAITDHVDFDPSMPAYGFASFEAFMRDQYAKANQYRAEFGPVALPTHNDLFGLFSDNVYGGGALVLEVGDGQAGDVAARLRELGFQEVRVSEDLAGRERVVEGRRP